MLTLSSVIASLPAEAHHRPDHKPTQTATSTITHTPMPTGTATQMATHTLTPTHTHTHTLTPTQAATATQAPTNTPGATTPDHPCAGGSLDVWHGTLEGTMHCGHEHGDAPPAWLTTMRYSGPFNTSVHENGHGPDAANPNRLGKHNAHKGLAMPVPGGELYFRYHAASNVLDRMARFHSYELWVRESSGTISHIQGWTNSGVPTRFGAGTAGAGGRRDNCSAEIDIRPELQVVTSMQAFNGGCTPVEFWYFYPIGANGQNTWGLTTGFGLHATTLAFANEAANPSMTTWHRTGVTGTARFFGLSLDLGGVPVRGQPFWTTQFLEPVSGPSDPKCSASTTFRRNPTAGFHPFDADETHPNVCLQQVVSPTLQGFFDQRTSRVYPSTGIVLPN